MRTKQILFSLLLYIAIFTLYFYGENIILKGKDINSILIPSLIFTAFTYPVIRQILNIMLRQYSKEFFIPILDVIYFVFGYLNPSFDIWFFKRGDNIVKELFYKKLFTHFVINSFNKFLKEASKEEKIKIDCEFNPDKLAAVYLGRIPLLKTDKKIHINSLAKKYREAYKEYLGKFLKEKISLIKEIVDKIEKKELDYTAFSNVAWQARETLRISSTPKNLIGGINVEAYVIDEDDKKSFCVIYLPPYFRHKKDSFSFDGLYYETDFPKTLVHEILHCCIKGHPEEFSKLEDLITKKALSEFEKFISGNKWKVYKEYFLYLFSVLKNKKTLWN